MLRDWVHNLSLEHLQNIVSDVSACRHAVWRLAYAELARRRMPPSSSAGLSLDKV